VKRKKQKKNIKLILLQWHWSNISQLNNVPHLTFMPACAGKKAGHL